MITLVMDKPKGGRGHTAPYDTKQMRVPVGLESQIQELISRYRDWISEVDTQTVGANNPPILLDKAVDNFIKPVDKLESEIEELHKLVDKLTQQRNALDVEVNELHTRNGELNLQLAELREQIKPVDKLMDKPVDKLTEVAVDSSSKPVDKLVNKPVDKLSNSKLEPMSQRSLAKRLGIAHVTVGRRQEKEDFISWSQELDPDQVGWRFDPKSRLFYPVETEVTER